MAESDIGEAQRLLSNPEKKVGVGALASALASAGPLNDAPSASDDDNKLRRLVWGWSAMRLRRLKRLNVVRMWLLRVTLLLLLALVGFIYYQKVYLPRIMQEELQRRIEAHAGEARVRAEKCRGVDWQTACNALSGAGARRRYLHGGDNHSSVEVADEDLLFSDDPTVTYDKFCLIKYRMRLYGNITFPYHASSNLASGGHYTLALLIQHGAMRNSEQYFCSFKQLMLEQGYRDFRNILVIAPNFNYESDSLIHPNDIFWNSSKPWGDWRVGAESDPDCCGNKGRVGTPKTMSSFEVLDHILATLTSKKLFPNMEKISYVGHSAGE